MKQPLMLVHINREPKDDAETLIRSAAINLHMAAGEAALLEYYCKQSTCFRPSVSRIEKSTGLKKCYLLRARRLLEEDGLILITDKCIYIDWHRLRLFASLDPSAMPKQRCRRRIEPVKLKTGYRFSKEFIFRTKYQMTMEETVQWLSRIGEEEYEIWQKVVHHNI